MAMFLATLGVCLIYESYRYPFQINSRATSQTYSDTPFALQAGKYFVLGVIAATLLVGARRPITRVLPDLLLPVSCAWIGARSLLAVAASGETASLDVAAPFVFGGLVAVLLPIRVSGRVARWAAATTVAIHAAASAAQIVLWLTIGRLPALSWSGGLTRFGGLWDDPNSVGVLSALVVVYLVARRSYPWWLIGLAAFNVVVSVSYSAGAALVVGLWVVLLSRNRPYAFALAPVIVAAAIAVFVVPFENVPVAGEWLDVKQESALLRLDEATLLTPGNWLFGGSSPTQSESSIAALIGTAGLVGLFLVVAWLVVCLRWTPAATREWLVPVLVGFLFASQLVPYIGVFPIGTLFPLLLSQAARQRTRELEASELNDGSSRPPAERALPPAEQLPA